jgi:hypothetical protein
MPCAQPVLDAGDAQDENLGAAGGISVIGDWQDKLPRQVACGAVRPRTFFIIASGFAPALIDAKKIFGICARKNISKSGIRFAGARVLT